MAAKAKQSVLKKVLAAFRGKKNKPVVKAIKKPVQKPTRKVVAKPKAKVVVTKKTVVKKVRPSKTGSSVTKPGAARGRPVPTKTKAKTSPKAAPATKKKVGVKAKPTVKSRPVKTAKVVKKSSRSIVPASKKLISPKAQKKVVSQKPVAKKAVPRPALQPMIKKPIIKKIAIKKVKKPVVTKKPSSPAVRPVTVSAKLKKPVQVTIPQPPVKPVVAKPKSLSQPVAKPVVSPLQSGEMPKSYVPGDYETEIYRQWEKSGGFEPKPNAHKGQFVIPMPPPNVTGVLHLGHASMLALEDIMVRFHRMWGDETLWLPGTDHAAISTQFVVENELRKKGVLRENLGRDKFLEECWKWKDHCHSVITSQIRQMGASCDWNRERFTMDAGLNRAVRQIFVDLYNKGKIYRGQYIVNWCPACQTAISDIETGYKEQQTQLYYIRYFVKAADKSVIVATTRPETMLGDVAVAVNPQDKRYKEYIGKTLILPILNREIPVIADEMVDMNFGTGAVKITPAHDPVDFKIAERHKLPSIIIIGKDGKMNKNSGKFAGLSTQQARENIVQYLDNIGNLEQTENYNNKISIHERCGQVIEPMVSEQWFMRVQEAASKALKYADKGEIKFIPERFEKVYRQWMNNLNDWCISRQLWWGHQIPAYYCKKCQKVEVGLETPTKCSACKGTEFIQDPDTLDTWFSSALWPFSTLGWPLKTDDLKKYFPNTVLETGYDIIFFWVARMVIMSAEVFDKTPFKTVYLHGLVRDEKGRKMSKSTGNGVDPLLMIERYGADALRLSLILGNTPGLDLKFSETKVESFRNFMNKLWNASRFIMQQGGNKPYRELEKEIMAQVAHLTVADRWILNRLRQTVEDVTSALHHYRFSEVGLQLYDFTWGEFCDWYIEFSKKYRGPQTGNVLSYTMLTLLQLWHPFIPYITEVLWKRFEQKGLLMQVAWPTETKTPWKDEEKAMQQLIEVIVALRNIRNNYHIEPAQKGPITVDVPAGPAKKLLQEVLPSLELLARVNELKFGTVTTAHEKIVAGPYTVYFVPADYQTEAGQERQTKEIERLSQFITQLEARLQDKNYLAKANPTVVARDRARLAEEKAKLAKLKA